MLQFKHLHKLWFKSKMAKVFHQN